jgi:hypothetical protein
MPRKRAPKADRPEVPPTVTRDAAGVEISVPFRRDFNEGLKESIPHRYREFEKRDERAGVWIVREPWAQPALDIVDLFYRDVVYVDLREGDA